ncbi:MAG: acyltransferase [Microthrixaceae bacterium]|nr:acyltransferase [Microthrixaceae bacterium]
MTRPAALNIWALAGEAAAKTPPSRDRVVDLLRGGSLAVVVIGHTLMAVVTWKGSTPVIGNLLAEIPELQVLTWVLQVMPVFFAAGAIANRASWNAAGAKARQGSTQEGSKQEGSKQEGSKPDWAAWMWGRTARLMRPVVWFLAVWIPLVIVLRVAVGPDADPLARLSTQLLWFLGVYIVVVAFTPNEVRWARRGPLPVVAMLGAVAVVDLVRFNTHDAVGLINFVLVWVMAATLGLVARDRIDRPRLLLGWAAAALAVEIAVVTLGPYPMSMVGMPGEKVSNMAPPTLALALHSVVLICVVSAGWNPLQRWCRRPRVWHTVCAVGAVAMSLYLWHLSALIIVTVSQHQLGLDRPEVGTGWFWPATLVHTVVCLVAVVLLVSVTAPLEHLSIPWLETPARRRRPVWVGVVGVICIAVSLLAFSATGLEGFPFGRVVRFAGVPLSPGLAVIVLAVGVLAVRASGTGTEAGAGVPGRRPSSPAGS